MDNGWEAIKARAYELLPSVSSIENIEVFNKRLKFEIQEIEKQGAISYWLNIINSSKKFKSNPNHLLLPYVFGLVQEDPLTSRKDVMLCSSRAADVKDYIKKYGSVPADIIKDQDMPDIDIDCLPAARDPLKEYALKQYKIQDDNDEEFGPVCSVGTWTTYKFKSAIIATSRALNAVELYEVHALTKSLPDEVDDLKEGGLSVCKGFIIDADTGQETECKTQHDQVVCPRCNSPDTEGPTLGKILAENEDLVKFNEKYPEVISISKDLVGRVSNMGMHSGAIIISDRNLFGSIPMAKSGSKGFWLSMWTEGRNTQLSKFGFCKWDFLGLKTLEYIFNCCKLIEKNRGISFGDNASGWDDIDPDNNRAGHYFDGNGNKQYIDLNDPHALRLANEQKTDAIFQFDTDLAKSNLIHGVRHFNDLMLLNAMGHPGPMASIPEAMANRDDERGLWKARLHPDILEILGDTYGVIVYQEQLQAIWQRMAGFTAPEAQEARKAVAKKWTHKLKPIKAKWLEGASKSLGMDEAVAWWDKMESFGRYAFNKSHSVSYCLMALRCLWLKAHFAPEFWACVMSGCHPDKIPRYMSVSRSEGWIPTDITYSGKHVPTNRASGIKFDTLNINSLTASYTATGDIINPGMIGVKGIGEKAAETFEGDGVYNSIDEFILPQDAGTEPAPNRKNKAVLERLIKLGAFAHLPQHDNSKALWMYYQYNYTSDTDYQKSINSQVLQNQGWNEKTIAEEVNRQIAAYKSLYPKRNKIPAKIINWKPKVSQVSLDMMQKLYPDDYTLSEKLQFQKEYLGFYLNSPLELFQTRGNSTIKDAKELGLTNREVMLEVMITAVDIGTTKPREGQKTGSQFAKVTVTDGVQTSLIFIWKAELDNIDPAALNPGVGIRIRVNFDSMRNTFSMCRNTTFRTLRLKDAD